MFLPFGDTPNPRSTAYVNWFLIGLNVAVFFVVTVPLMMARVDLTDPLLIDYLRSIGVRGFVSPQDVLQHVNAYQLFVFRYGFRPADPSIISLFSCMFLHGSWMHLAGNMLFLYIFGNNVEVRLGAPLYLLVYLVSGVVATVFFALFVPGSQVPLV